MNDDRVVTIEKKASNKIGLLLLIIFVLGGLGFGAYYYLTNKNLINFEFKLPWQKEDTEEKEEKIIVDGKQIENKIKKEKDLERRAVKIPLNTPFYKEDVEIEAISNELKDGSYIIKLKMTNNNPASASGPYVVKVKAVAVNNYLFTQSFTLQTNYGEQMTYDLVLPAQELDKNRLNSFSKINLIADITYNGETEEKIITIISDDGDEGADIATIAELANINKTIKKNYYKKEETNEGTKLYFLLNNYSGSNLTYYIEKLIVDNKEVDVSKYKEVIYSNTIYIPVIELPKNILNQNRKIVISFIFQSENKSIYKTSEKEIKI